MKHIFNVRTFSVYILLVSLVPELVVSEERLLPRIVQNTEQISRALSGSGWEYCGVAIDPSNPNILIAMINGGASTGRELEEYYGKLVKMDLDSNTVLEMIEVDKNLAKASKYDVDKYGGIALGDGVVYVVSNSPPEIVVIDKSFKKVQKRISIAGSERMGGIAYNPKTKTLAIHVWTGDAHLLFLDPESGTTLAKVPADDSIQGLLFFEDKLMGIRWGDASKNGDQVEKDVATIFYALDLNQSFDEDSNVSLLAPPKIGEVVGSFDVPLHAMSPVLDGDGHATGFMGLSGVSLMPSKEDPPSLVFLRFDEVGE